MTSIFSRFFSNHPGRANGRSAEASRRQALKRAAGVVAAAGASLGSDKTGTTARASSSSSAPVGIVGDRTRRDFVTFPSDGHGLAGVLHAPIDASAKRCPGVLILHGFVGSKDAPHRIFVTLAEALARAGVVSLRFDLRGRGDSAGESVDITPDSDLADARAGLELLAGRPEVDPQRLAVVGLSWGGLLACYLSADPRVGKTALWSAVPTDRLNWRPKLFDLNGRQVADEWGNLIGSQFYDGLKSFRPLSELKKTTGPVLLGYGTADWEVTNAVPQAAQALKDAGVKTVLLPVAEADHAFMRSAWERELIDGTVRWLAE